MGQASNFFFSNRKQHQGMVIEIYINFYYQQYNYWHITGHSMLECNADKGIYRFFEIINSSTLLGTKQQTEAIFIILLRVL